MYITDKFCVKLERIESFQREKGLICIFLKSGCVMYVECGAEIDAIKEYNDLRQEFTNSQ